RSAIRTVRRYRRSRRGQGAHYRVEGKQAFNACAPGGPGEVGMYEFVETHVRRLVADHLGVGVEELVPEVSLRDDLAADSLDFVELALAFEARFGIGVPEHILDQVRSYGDLVEAALNLIRS